MAFVKKQIKDTQEKFIHPEDSAIDREKSDLESYRDTWDREHITIKEGETPTYFVVKTRLSAAEKRAIANKGVGVSEDGATIQQGTLAYETVRLCLVDIQNPDGVDGIEFKKASNGMASETTVNELTEHQALNDIFSLFTVLQDRGTDELKNA